MNVEGVEKKTDVSRQTWKDRKKKMLERGEKSKETKESEKVIEKWPNKVKNKESDRRE